jgi:hypothetical protein
MGGMASDLSTTSHIVFGDARLLVKTETTHVKADDGSDFYTSLPC